MNTAATAVLQDGTEVTGRLTTEHAASSYGQPVFVTDDGEAIDAWQIVKVIPQEGLDTAGTVSERMPQEKLDAVLRALRRTHPNATAADVRTWLDYPWGAHQAEHNAWAQDATATEVARWVAARMQDGER